MLAKVGQQRRILAASGTGQREDAADFSTSVAHRAKNSPSFLVSDEISQCRGSCMFNWWIKSCRCLIALLFLSFRMNRAAGSLPRDVTRLINSRVYVREFSATVYDVRVLMVVA